MARTKLTKRVVDALVCPPEKVRVTLFNSEIAGLHVEAMRSGRKFYRLKWKRRGQQGRETLGEHGVITVEQARGRATALRGRMYEGQSPAQKRAVEAGARLRAISISELVETWLREGRAAAPTKRESSWSTDARKLRAHIIPLLGRKGAGDITRADVENTQWKIAQGVTANDKQTKPHGRSIVRGGEGVARSAVMSLSACFSWAISRGIIDANPCQGLKKPKPRKRERFLTREEAIRLFTCLDDMEARLDLDSGFADVVRLLLLTGARKSEVQNLEWCEIDFDRQIIRLPRERSKTGEKHIPLGAEAVKDSPRQENSNCRWTARFPGSARRRPCSRASEGLGTRSDAGRA